MGCGFKLAVDVANVLLQRSAQFSGDFGRRFTVAFAYLVLKLGNSSLHSRSGFFAQIFEDCRVDFGLRWSAIWSYLGGRRRYAAHRAQLISPYGHSGQRRSAVPGGFHRNGNGCLKSLPYRQQLTARRIKQWRKFSVNAGPIAVTGNRVCLSLPVGHVRLQCVKRGLCVAPRLDRQHLNTLGN